jgi:DNA modification methylase
MILTESASALKYTPGELIVTDPPYNIGYKYNGYEDNLTPEKYSALFAPMVGHRAVIIHYVDSIYQEIAPILGNPEKVVSWVYPSNLGKSWRAIAWFNCKPDFRKYRIPYRNMNDKRIKEINKRTGGRALPDYWEVNIVKNTSREKVKEYTNQIPEEIIRRIIATTAAPGDIITDPFCGTGTTPLVASQMGYKSLSFDINPIAVDLAKTRTNGILL